MNPRTHIAPFPYRPAAKPARHRNAKPRVTDTQRKASRKATKQARRKNR